MFGGIYNLPSEKMADVKSVLSNTTLIMQTYKSQQGSKEQQQLLQFQINKSENKKILINKEPNQKGLFK